VSMNELRGTTTDMTARDILIKSLGQDGSRFVTHPRWGCHNARVQRKYTDLWITAVTQPLPAKIGQLILSYIDELSV
jgi:hypothetical protein